MTTRNQWIVIAALIGVMGAGIWLTAVRLGADLYPLSVGSRAPDFSAVVVTPTVGSASGPASGSASPTSDPVSKGIADYKGEVVLLNVWATWCLPCRVEMPSMQRLETALGPKGLRIVAVSVDDPGMEARIRAYREEAGLTFEILYDAPGRILQQYQATGVPETFVIGRDGIVRRRTMGAADWSSVANIAFFERLLAEPAGQ